MRRGTECDRDNVDIDLGQIEIARHLAQLVEFMVNSPGGRAALRSRSEPYPQNI
jgi:hypothetical protein